MDIRVVVIVVKYIEGIEMRVDTCFARCLEPMDESHRSNTETAAATYSEYSGVKRHDAMSPRNYWSADFGPSPRFSLLSHW